MKNIGKIVGIIAILAVIGLMTGCETEADPDDQITITFINLPDEANGRYAIMGIQAKANIDAVSSAPKVISGNNATTEMVYPKGHKLAGGAFGKEGSYTVIIAFYETSDIEQEEVYAAKTTSKVSIKKGGNEVDASKLYPDVTTIPAKPSPSDPTVPSPPPSEAPEKSDFGTYIGTGANNSKETIEFSKFLFGISDDTNGAGKDEDYLTFSIEKWDDAAVPSAYSATYPKGYKFTGKITAASDDGDDYIPSSKTAPGTTMDDVKADGKGPEFHMYLYSKGSGDSFVFIRTPFIKTGATTDDTTAITQSGSAGDLRVYTRKPAE